MRSPALQRFVLRAHASAFRKLADALPPIERIAIVGGGMYPRTALILSRLLPAARIAVIDRSRANLDRARPLLSGKIEFVHAHFVPAGNIACDLLVVPLSFQGNRDAIYARPPAAAVIVHDWIWRKRGESRVVSIWLLKRINLLRR
jgi:hypothetical protein